MVFVFHLAPATRSENCKVNPISMFCTIDMSAIENLPSCSVMSRKRYKIIEEYVTAHVAQDVAAGIMRCVCETMHFDPNVGMLTPKRKQHVQARLKRIAEEGGLTLHDAVRGKAARDKIKALKNGSTYTANNNDGIDRLDLPDM